MNRSGGLQRRLFALFTVVLCAAAAALFATRSPALGAPVTVTPAAEARVRPAPSSWSAAPSTTTRSGSSRRSTARRPRPATCPASPGPSPSHPTAQNVAYLPENGGAAGLDRVRAARRPRRISLAGAGVKRVDSFSWVDGGRLLVAGVKSRRPPAAPATGCTS